MYWNNLTHFKISKQYQWKDNFCSSTFFDSPDRYIKRYVWALNKDYNFKLNVKHWKWVLGNVLSIMWTRDKESPSSHFSERNPHNKLSLWIKVLNLRSQQGHGLQKTRDYYSCPSVAKAYFQNVKTDSFLFIIRTFSLRVNELSVHWANWRQ